MYSSLHVAGLLTTDHCVTAVMLSDIVSIIWIHNLLADFFSDGK